ncbi:MAG: ATP-binding protein [Defluviitaleaceae bacterium]|nr:ATP-binding protein [Defluviitaleaceae bacterium]
MKVKSRILLLLIIVIVATTVVLASIRATQVRIEMDTLLEESLKGNANMTFGIFETAGVYTMWMLDVAANHVRLWFADEGYDTRAHLANLWSSMNREMDGIWLYENIAVFDTDFNPTAAANPYGELPDIRMLPEYPSGHLAEPWISPVFECVGGRLQFLFAQPVFYGENFIGTVAITVNTQMLAHFLRDFVQVYDSFVNIADSSGVIFFSNRPEAYMGRHVGELGVIEAFGYIPMNTVFAHTSALTGIDKIAYVTHDPYLNWSIVSFFDAHAVESTARIIVASLLPMVIVIILAAVLMMVIINWSLKPLQNLADGAKEVSNGNIAVTFRVDRNDEISQVSIAFMGIVRALNILRSNFKKAENAMARGEMEYKLEDSRLGGIYDEMLASTGNIVGHMKQAMKQAEAASKAKSDFLSKMSHEIRTPMNAIIGMAELVLREDISASTREQTTTIKQSGDHLLSIINDILDLSKVESGKMELVLGDYIFHSTIHDVISIIKMRMANPDVRFAAYMQADIPYTLFGDEVRVRQILLNVLTNALKYTVEGHFSLDIFGEKKDGMYLLIIKIKDTGIGIKPEDLEKLFGEFAQFDLEKNRNIEGTGLGLAITHSLVTLMKGTIEVNSIYTEGSEFIITLPQEYKESDCKAPDFSDKSVLLYCRTHLNIDYISRTLEDLSVKYHVVKNESDLRDRLTEGGWDFVFAEADMSYAAHNIIKSCDLTTKIVMLTDSYDATYEARDGQDFTLLVMPAYFISVMNILNGRGDDYTADERHTEQFIAPDARILLVDDIETNLRVGQGLLKLYGMSIDTCLSGRDAIESVMSNNYDLVLMDHMMPEMDGVETVKLIRKIGGKYADLPIVALTANAIVGAKEMFLSNGFNDFLSKPIEISKLNNVLEKWIPKEKQMKGSINQATEEDCQITIEGVDVKRGIMLSGGSSESYLNTLAVFRKDGKIKAAELPACLDEGNITLYTTYVHALKSACANVGAAALSEEAKYLEEAGIKKDLAFISANNDGFLLRLEKLLADIGDVIEKYAPSRTSDLDAEALKEHLVKLKAAIEAFDVTAIDQISASLEGNEEVSDILQNAFVGMYDEALAQIHELMNE